MTDDPVSGNAPERRAPRWMTLLLVLSLAVNLLIAGMVIGSVATRDRDRHGGRSDLAGDLGRTPFVAALDRDDRRALARALMREAGPLRESRYELKSRVESLLSAIRAEPFDRAAVERLIADQRHAAGRRQELGERLLLDYLEGLSTEARRAYADRLDRSIRRAP